jgi:phytoene desaturase
MSKIAVIGSGFSGMSAAAYLAAAGHEVHVLERHDRPGGRARQFFTDQGYIFDMGPSWYWMPDVFERFFADFGSQVSDFYELRQLTPSFDMIFADGPIRVPENMEDLCLLFERVEQGSAFQLLAFLREAKYKYRMAMEKLAFMPGLSMREFADVDLLKGLTRMQVFSSFSKHVRKYFSHSKLVTLMEFPVLFLGAMPQQTPALYSLMNYAALQLGTWYPMGGFGEVVRAVETVARKNGAIFHFNCPVERIVTDGQRARGIVTTKGEMACDAVVASADYHHVESQLLPSSERNYKEAYWSKKTFAPSSLIFYIGLSKKLPLLQHHTLFFEEDLFEHSKEIYQHPQWPTRPLFYVCCPSHTDETVAPAGHENLFLLMPIAPGLPDEDALREKYFDLMIRRLEKHLREPIKCYIDFKRSYCVNDFIADYHAYKGNAYGLANTLAQTALLKPGIRNKKIRNLFYAGQLTVPGPGVPPALISGKIVAGQLLKHLKTEGREAVIR